jgi:hypothetical protein
MRFSYRIATTKNKLWGQSLVEIIDRAAPLAPDSRSVTTATGSLTHARHANPQNAPATRNATPSGPLDPLSAMKEITIRFGLFFLGIASASVIGLCLSLTVWVAASLLFGGGLELVRWPIHD